MSRPLYLILPNIRSAHNVGAMFRTADACGVAHMYLVGYTARPPKPQIDKVSLGAEQWVSWSGCGYLRPLLKRLKKQKIRLVALEQTKASKNIAQVCFSGSTALIVGNEVTGVPGSILSLCDEVVHIPMRGMKRSLNVSVAAGIALYTIRESLGPSSF